MCSSRSAAVPLLIGFPAGASRGIAKIIVSNCCQIPCASPCMSHSLCLLLRAEIELSEPVSAPARTAGRRVHADAGNWKPGAEAKSKID